MKPVRILPLLCSLGLLAQGAAAASDQRAHDLPAREGLCVRSTISAIGERLVDGTNDQPIPGSGSSVDFADGLNQVGYDELLPIKQSRVGDHVMICLIRIPKACPPGDDRGRIYTTTNLRTLESWTLADSEHGCGGA